MKNYFQAFGLFAVCALVGYGIISLNSQDSLIARDPAAINKTFDFSHLRGSDLEFAVKQRLLAGVELQKENGDQGISFGHFVFVDASGQKKFACQEFNKINLTFVADGMATSGEAAEMVVQGNCEFSSDATRINPLWIPVAKILNEKVADGEYNYQQTSNVSVKFDNVSDEWPKTWLLKSIELKKENSAETMSIQGDEVSKVLGRPFVIKF